MKTTNPLLRQRAVMLERRGRAEKARIWIDAAERLARSSSGRSQVNVGHISRIVDDGAVVFVPGKVLASGVIQKKVVVGAHSFSSSARRKLVSAGGEALTVEDFLRRYPKGSGVLLVE